MDAMFFMAIVIFKVFFHMNHVYFHDTTMHSNISYITGIKETSFHAHPLTGVYVIIQTKKAQKHVKLDEKKVTIIYIEFFYCSFAE